MINHLLEGELRTQELRETVYQDIRAGRKNILDGFDELVAYDRNASSQKIGFLVGYAMAFRIDSEALTRARASFAGLDVVAQAANRAAHAADDGRGASGDAEMTESNRAREENQTNRAVEGDGHAAANNHEHTNGTDTTIMTNGHVTANGNGEASSEDPTLILSPLVDGETAFQSEV